MNRNDTDMDFGLFSNENPSFDDDFQHSSSAPRREPKPMTVSELNSIVKSMLEETFRPFWLTGEVGNITIHPSGHVYLNLKDQACQVKAVFFHGAQFCRNTGIRMGSQVEVLGTPSLYQMRGDFQFNISRMRLAGVGDLHEQFERLKAKLAAEGIFDPSHKLPVPSFPKHIGLISSPSGAAVKDFIKIAVARFPGVHIRICPAPVQGEGAGAKLARAVRFFNRVGGVDVIVLTRGGGSLEDLWPFNDEGLARSIYASKIPVVSAVGHEIDFSISDFAADMRAPTPSGAAELLLPEKSVLVSNLHSLDSRMFSAANYALERASLRLARVLGSKVFRDSSRLTLERMQKIDLLLHDAETAMLRAFDRASYRLERANNSLDAFDPFRVLQRGYAFLLSPENNHQFNGVDEIAPGSHVRAVMADGIADLTANSTEQAPLRSDGRADLLGLIRRHTEKKDY